MFVFYKLFGLDCFAECIQSRNFSAEDKHLHKKLQLCVQIMNTVAQFENILPLRTGSVSIETIPQHKTMLCSNIGNILYCSKKPEVVVSQVGWN